MVQFNMPTKAKKKVNRKKEATKLIEIEMACTRNGLYI